MTRACLVSLQCIFVRVCAAPAIAMMLIAGSGNGLAQTATLKVVYPFVAGGSGDVLARIVADRLSASLGMPAIVENRAGAAGRLAAQAIAAAEPDGTTLLFASSPMMVIYPHAYAALDYNPVTDFAPIGTVAAFDIALVVGPQMTARSITELVDWLRANPAQGSYGSPGAGGVGHFAAVMFAAATRLDLRHVTYRGSGAVATDLAAGQLPLAMLPLGDITELHKSGKVRALASAGTSRSSFLPDVPTLREAGIDTVGQGWYGLYAPARTPPPTIEKLSKALMGILAVKEVRDRVADLSLEPIPSTPVELAARQRAELASWGPVVKSSGFKPEQ